MTTHERTRYHFRDPDEIRKSITSAKENIEADKVMSDLFGCPIFYVGESLENQNKFIAQEEQDLASAIAERQQQPQHNKEEQA